MSDDREGDAPPDEQRKRNARRLRALLLALPPLSGELTELEIAHLRTLRAVSDESFAAIASFVEFMLLRDAERGRLVQPLRGRLQLVVDNDGCAPR
jgi:hypothetical protein